MKNIVSFAVLGATVSAMVAGSITEALGKKRTIIVSDLFTIAGPGIQFMATTVFELCLGRLLLGIGMGINMMASQVYMSESSPIPLRG